MQNHLTAFFFIFLLSLKFWYLQLIVFKLFLAKQCGDGCCGMGILIINNHPVREEYLYCRDSDGENPESTPPYLQSHHHHPSLLEPRLVQVLLLIRYLQAYLGFQALHGNPIRDIYTIFWIIHVLDHTLSGLWIFITKTYFGICVNLNCINLKKYT